MKKPRKNYYKHHMTETQYKKYTEALRRLETRAKTITRKQSHAEKQCYPEYVYWKMELEKSMRRMRMFIYWS